MVRSSILAAHEQVNPVDLLRDVIEMEQNGIEKCWTSDHYMPWWRHSGASGGAAWPSMGAALAKTNRIVIGTGITPPILRYHPAIVAQVFATLGFMFKNRVFLSIGREALNKVPSGNYWPSNYERFERLKEAIQLIKKLWIEDWVNFKVNIIGLKILTCILNLKRPFRCILQDLVHNKIDWPDKRATDLLLTSLMLTKLKTSCCLLLRWS
jgi:alkanesulfonate monooxygenase SsuD/methylene tetrahydromethanopterin reductase-like flavin-dependent oxidoreductase (luciferase family)